MLRRKDSLGDFTLSLDTLSDILLVGRRRLAGRIVLGLGLELQASGTNNNFITQ